ncbi:TonB-dependent receptor domain-containing protein [Williamwhitmania taraxaci]|uniref:Outer membrane receptor proteins, mostly Fe transport n=1 Tax=Williamwhitmania taraxaci TaxID=1640674 RepID=A0A1G6SNL2_9BACT|nr:outer membrane beta-barrel family protein [Williamwhitmania taraxaci]SDD18492.1 Outer membrane receptor proteins, mostly Fe transport [Williamwhitmania taraxaci]
MKWMKLIVTVLLTFSLSYIFAQNLIVSGKVISNENEVLPYATVVVFNTDKSVITGDITNENGLFSINGLQQGEYTLEVSFVGYESYSVTINLEQSIMLDTIRLNAGVSIGEIEVSAHRKMLKSDQGRLILTVKDSYLTRLPNATDVMAFVPGVVVQGENIEVAGKGIPLIFINGREVKNRAQISSLQPERIKSIMVDRNPSAKYDASYNSTIHITTTAAAKQELSAQLVHGSVMGRLYNHSETLNINHAAGNWTNFLSYKYKNARTKEGAEVFQDVQTTDIAQRNSYNAWMTENQHLHSLVFGSNLKVNDKHSLDLQYYLDKSRGNANINGTETLTGQQNETYNVLRDFNKNNEKHTLNLNYRWDVDSVNHFNLYADYLYLDNTDNENVNNVSTTDASNDSYILNNRSKFNTYALRAEYNTLLFGAYTLDAGVRFSEIKSNTFSEIVALSQNEDTENKSVMTEHTLAAYTTLGREFGNFSAEAGLRAERNEGEYLKNSVSVFDGKRILSNWFPSLSLSYTFSEKAQLNLNYTSKISRPSFLDLDPSVSYLSSVLYEQGNPELKPTTSQTFELGGTFWDNLNLSIDYTRAKNAVAYLVEPDKANPNLLINQTINIDKVSSLGVNATYNFAVEKWRSNLIGNVSVPFMEYPYQGEKKNNNITKYQLITTNSYMVSPKLFLIGNFVAQSRYSYLNNCFSPTYTLVLAANFVMLKGKMVLTVFGNDLLQRSESDASSEWGYVSTGQNVMPDSRMVGVTVKFNLNKFENKFSKIESGNDELQRIEKE